MKDLFYSRKLVATFSAFSYPLELIGFVNGATRMPANPKESVTDRANALRQLTIEEPGFNKLLQLVCTLESWNRRPSGQVQY